MKERFGIILTPKVWLLLVFGIIMSSISSVYFIKQLLHVNTGLVSVLPEITLQGDSIVFSPRDPLSRPIVRELRPHQDVINEINGKQIHSVRDFVRSLFEIKDSSRIRVSVTREKAMKLEFLLEPSPGLLRIDWIFTLALALACGILGFFLILRFGNNIEYTVGAAACFLFMLHGCARPFCFESGFSFALVQLGSATPWLMALFSLYFPCKKGSRRIRLAIIVFASTLLLAFTGMKILLFQSWTGSGSNGLYELIILMESVTQIGQTIAVVAFVALCIFSYIRTRLSREKRQLEWILLGILISYLPFFFFERLPYLLDPGASGSIGLGSFSSVFLAVFPVFFFIGIATNKSFSLRFTLSRLLVAVCIVLILSAFYLLSVEPLSAYLTDKYGLPLTKSVFAVSFAACFALFILNFVLDAVFKKYSRINPVESFIALEGRFTKLLLDHERAVASGKREIQSEKISDLASFFKALKEKITEETGRLKNAVRSFEELFKKLILENRRNARTDRIELVKDKEEAEKMLGFSKESLLKIEEVFSKIDSVLDTKPAIPSWTYPEYLIKKAVYEPSRKYPDAEITISMQSDNKIYCFQHEVIRILQEILLNAIESQAPPFCKVSVSVRSTERKTCFEITDFGSGISESIRKRVFTPFFTTKPGHAGLGLYIAFSYAEKNEGTIDFAEKQGKGAHVTISFPDERMGNK